MYIQRMAEIGRLSILL